MNETNPGSSYKSSRITPVSGSAVIIPPQGVTGGPETVINQDARPISQGSQVLEQVQISEPGQVSELATVLFSTTTPGSGSHFPGPLGILLGHFRIESCIRNGGMGAVFKAVDMRLNRIVALKVLPPNSSRDPSIVQRFRHEAQAVAQLDHENIARVHFIGEDQGLHFIAFEFVSGSNLRDLIQERGTIHPEDAVNYALQMAHALVHMSKHGVIHRDIKPSNIIVTPEGRVKLVDLGLARLEDRDPAEQLTVAGTTLGTFDYISPEQAKDPRTVDVRSDIYSLGCSLYHMLTGVPPYAEGTMLQKLLDHQAKDVPDPRLKNRFLSADLSAIVQKMMAPDPQGRYQTPEHLIRDLLYVAESMGLQKIATDGQIWITAQPQRMSFLQKHGGWLISAVVLMLFVAFLKYSDDRSARVQMIPPAKSIQQGSPVGQEKSETDAPAGITGQGVDATTDGSNLTEVTPKGTDELKGKQTVSTETSGSETPKSPSSDGNAPAENIAKNSSENGTEENGSLLLTKPEDVFPKTPALFEGVTGDAVRSNIESKAKSSDSATTLSKPSDTQNPSNVLDLNKSAPFALMATTGTADRRYPTLEAACADAVDGSIIELRFDGLQKQRPIRITKKVTIRAGRGNKPQLEIAPQAGTSDDGRLITINGGQLLLVDVDLVVRSTDKISSDVWTLFSVQKGEQLKLENSSVTLLQESGKGPYLVEFQRSPPDTLMGMDPGGTQANRSPFRFELLNSFVHGDGNIFLVRHAQGLRLSVNNCILAVTGVLMRSEGTPEFTRQSGAIELQLLQNTLVVNGGLISFEAGELPRNLSPVDVVATNNIITAKSDASLHPLISMIGAIPQDDFTALLKWSGLKNFYYPFEIFWSVQSTDVTGKSMSQKFADWTRRWGADREVGAQDGLILWLQSWSDKPFTELSPNDFQLDPSGGQTNPAIAGANDGDDAGVDLAELPERLFPPEGEEFEEAVGK